MLPTRICMTLKTYPHTNFNSSLQFSRQRSFRSRAHKNGGEYVYMRVRLRRGKKIMVDIPRFVFLIFHMCSPPCSNMSAYVLFFLLYHAFSLLSIIQTFNSTPRHFTLTNTTPIKRVRHVFIGLSNLLVCCLPSFYQAA